MRQVAREMKICRMTLKRFMEKKNIGEVTKTGYKRTGLANQVFKEYTETELADHIKALAVMFHGISAMKCCELAFEYASLYSPAVLTSGMLISRPDPDHLDLHTHRG